MAARGSALARAVRYFKEADIEEAHYVFHRASEILKERADALTRADAHHQARKPRRTKAQIAADRVGQGVSEDARAAQGVHG